MKTVAAVSLGCKVNAYDTDAMLNLFVGEGYTPVDFGGTADVYLVNTCAVTNISEQKSRKMLRQAAARNPGAVVIAAGCYAQVDPAGCLNIPGVDIVTGTQKKAEVLDAVKRCRKNGLKVNAVSDIIRGGAYEELPAARMSGRTRAYVKIQEGCENNCSYCIVPYARGDVKSRKPDDIYAEALRFARDGFKEIVITGTEIASYGTDLTYADLMDVVRLIHRIDGMERIRFSSAPPHIVTDTFIDTVAALPKICRHFHISLQSGSDAVLADMNRRYTADIYKNAVTRIKNAFPDVGITTDVIVGFPGETDADFEKTYELCEEIGFSKIHVFPYSPKKGTPAAVYANQTDGGTKKCRAERLTALSDALRRTFNRRFIGRSMPVLFEKAERRGRYEGYTDNYIRITAPSDHDLVNTIKIITVGPDNLLY